MPIKVNTIGTTPRMRRKTAKTNRPSRKSRRIFKAKTFLFSFITILIASLIVAGVYIYKFVNVPFSGASSFAPAKDDLWTNESINLLVVKVNDFSDKFSDVNLFAIVNIEPSNYRYKIYVFPLDDPLTLSEYPNVQMAQTIKLKDVYKTGAANDGDAISFARNLVVDNFAIGVDGYIFIDDKGYSGLSEIVDGQIDYNDLSGLLRLKNTFKLPGMVNQLRTAAKTNLTFYDVMHLLNFIKSTSESSSYIRYLNKYALLDPEVWDQIWREKLSTERIKREYTKILILNGSKDPKIPGLAKWGSRIVENTGGSILDMQNSFADFNENTIIATDTESYTVKKLKEILGVSTVIDKRDLDKSIEYNPEVERADVTLVVTSY